MGRAGDTRESRNQVVECFLTRRTKASLDGLVHTNGDTLCVGLRHVAFWHQGIIYMIPLVTPSAEDLEHLVQAILRLGTHGHIVAEVGVGNGDRTAEEDHS